MRLSISLLERIIKEQVEKTELNQECDLPKHPSPEEMAALILNSTPYLNTSTSKKNKLEKTIKIFDVFVGNSYNLPREVPLMKQGITRISADLELHGDTEEMTVQPRADSRYKKYTNEAKELQRQLRRDLWTKYNETPTLKQLTTAYPETLELNTVKAEIEHQKNLRREAALRRKNEVLTPIKTKVDTTTAIAKARLLGAKFLS